MEPDQWIVGVKRGNDVYGTITSSSHVNPSDITDIYIPIEFPWEEELKIYSMGLEPVESHDRAMGPEICHAVHLEDIVPDTDEFWEVDFELWEYPAGAFNMSRLEHSENIAIADLTSEALLNRIQPQD